MSAVKKRGGGKLEAGEGKREKSRKMAPGRSEESAETKSDVYGENYTV